MWLEVIALACLLAVYVVIGGKKQDRGFDAPERPDSDREYWG